jgi:aldehyde:ferredoxin oxidoreductase
MMKAGRRIFYLKRLLNYRYGLTAKDDDLTPRMLEPARDGEPEGVEINFTGMKEKFYDLMDMDHEKGIPSNEILGTYGLSQEAASVW